MAAPSWRKRLPLPHPQRRPRLHPQRRPQQRLRLHPLLPDVLEVHNVEDDALLEMVAEGKPIKAIAAATNSTQTPMNTRQRKISNCQTLVTNPEEAAAKAYSRMLQVSTRRRPHKSVR